MVAEASDRARHRADRFWLGPVAGLVLLCLLGGLYFLLTRPKPPAKVTPTLLSLTEGQIASLTFDAKGKTLTLYRGATAGGTTHWHIGSPAGAAADSTLVQSFVGNLVTLTATRTLTTNPTAAALKAYGLTPPTASVVVARTGGRPGLRMDVGARSPVGGYYTQVDGLPTVYVVSGMTPAEISANPSAWLPIPTTPASSGASSATASGAAAGATAASPTPAATASGARGKG